MDGTYSTAGQYVDAVQRMGDSLWDAWRVWTASNKGAQSGNRLSNSYSAAIDVAEKLARDVQQVQSDYIEFWRALAHPMRPSGEVRHLSDGVDTISELAESLLEVQRTSVSATFNVLRSMDGSEAWRKATDRTDPQRVFEIWEEFANAWTRAFAWPGPNSTGWRQATEPSGRAAPQRKSVNADQGGSAQRAAAGGHRGGKAARR